MLTENSAVKRFDFACLNQDDIKKALIPDNYKKISSNVAKINEEYYYCKQIDNEAIFNELIGSYLSKLIDLDAVDYEIGVCNNTVYAISKLFFEKGYYYQHLEEEYKILNKVMRKNMLYYFRRIYASYNILSLCSPSIKDELLKLIAVDLKMGQLDRHLSNLTKKKDEKTNEVSLAKIYDFEYSYGVEPFYPDQFYYENPYVFLRKNQISLKDFSRKYPQIRQWIDILQKVDIMDVIQKIEESKKIKLSSSQKELYYKEDKKNNKILKKLI